MDNLDKFELFLLEMREGDERAAIAWSLVNVFRFMAEDAECECDCDRERQSEIRRRRVN